MKRDQEIAVRLSWPLRFLRQLPFPRKLGVLERLFGWQLSKHGVAWVETQRGAIWKLNLLDVCHRWIVYGDYEGPVQMNWITSWLCGGGVVVDSGANVGEMAIYFSALDDIDLLCVEPVPENHAWLAECVSVNNLSNTRLINVALGSCEGFSEMQVDEGRSTMRLEWYSKKEFERDRVRVTTMDILARDYKLQRIRLWKLDVEGWEVPAIEGADVLLREKRIDAILVEATPYSFPDIQKALAVRGYQLGRISANGIVRVDSAPGHGNLVATPINSL